MKLSIKKLQQIISEEINILLSENLGNIEPHPDREPSSPAAFGREFTRENPSNKGKYNIMNGYLSYVTEPDGKGENVKIVNLKGPSGAYHYKDYYVKQLKSAGYRRDEFLTVPNPGQGNM